jgi:hypothetical protein
LQKQLYNCKNKNQQVCDGTTNTKIAVMKYFTLAIPLAFCTILIIMGDNVLNVQSLNREVSNVVEYPGSNAVMETHRLRLSETSAVIITTALDPDGEVELSEEIVPALPSDRYAVLDLRDLQTAVTGIQDFENVALQVLSHAGADTGIRVDEYKQHISSAPTGNIYKCECKSDGEDEACKVKKGKKSKVYCEAKSSECTACSLIVIWGNERIVDGSNKHSVIIFNH